MQPFSVSGRGHWRGGPPHSPRHKHGHQSPRAHPQVRVHRTEALGRRPLKGTHPPDTLRVAQRPRSTGVKGFLPRANSCFLARRGKSQNGQHGCTHLKGYIRLVPFTEQMLSTWCGHNGPGGSLCPQGWSLLTNPVPAVLPTPAHPPGSRRGHRTQPFRGAATGGTLAPSKAS